MTADEMAEVFTRIRPTLSFGDFKGVDIVVEAVVENEKVKKSVLAEVEGQVKEDAILASNTSTISITRLAEGLKRPENFCGMHFFNPVHKMPLVEVIRGAKSSDRAVATTVSYALAMGKTPIVVNDCPGFLVNRVLFPYFAGFMMLVNEGVDFQKIDKVMEKFGWPMGPAYLLDVVGIDTGYHANAVMARASPTGWPRPRRPRSTRCSRPSASARRTARASTPTSPTRRACRRRRSIRRSRDSSSRWSARTTARRSPTRTSSTG